MHLLWRNLCAAGKAVCLASKEGAELQVKKTVPVYHLGYWSRARFWREHLKPALPPAQYSEAMLKILGRLIRRSKAVAV